MFGHVWREIATLPWFSMVRLITHNLLACHVKGCTSNNFPLIFKDAQVEIREAEYNEDFLRGFMPKIEWDALVNGAKEVLGVRTGDLFDLSLVLRSLATPLFLINLQKLARKLKNSLRLCIMCLWKCVAHTETALN